LSSVSASSKAITLVNCAALTIVFAFGPFRLGICDTCVNIIIADADCTGAVRRCTATRFSTLTYTTETEVRNGAVQAVFAWGVVQSLLLLTDTIRRVTDVCQALTGCRATHDRAIYEFTFLLRITYPFGAVALVTVLCALAFRIEA
jgi:hypothetical protein